DDLGQALAAILRRAWQCAPAARHERVVGFLPAGRRHDSSIDKPRADAIADSVERVQHLAAKLARLLDNGARRFLVEIVHDATLDEIRQAGRRLEYEHDVIYGSPVRHPVILVRWRSRRFRG